MKYLTLFLMTMVFNSAASALDFESGNKRAVMVELFTSEGCNSCPPAEERLNQYRNDPGLWKTYVPLAWHVDYWDYLGWKDRYSSPDYSNRQRRYAQLQRSRTVYTPNFVVNGLNWRPGLFSPQPESGASNVGNLKVKLKDGLLTAQLDQAGVPPASLELHVALLGMGLVTEIRAGENAGRRAPHEFVVLRHQKVSGKKSSWRMAVDTGRINGITPGAIAVWLGRPGDPTPLQATGAMLSGKQ